MKKALLSLSLILLAATGAFAQAIRLTANNNTPQTFTAALLDDDWSGIMPLTYIDLAAGHSGVHPAYIYSGATLTDVSKWRGVCLRAYPSGIYYEVTYFTSAPYIPYTIVRAPYGAGIPVTVTCSVLSPTDLRLSIDP